MLCRKCGYLLDAVDVECPRCARLRHERETEQHVTRKQDARAAKQRDGDRSIEIVLDAEPDDRAARQPVAAPAANRAHASAPDAHPFSGAHTSVGKTCPFCQTPIKPGAAAVSCSVCGMPHHLECWKENGRCTTFGCPGAANGKADPPRQSVAGKGAAVNVGNNAKYGYLIAALILALIAAAFIIGKLSVLADQATPARSVMTPPLAPAPPTTGKSVVEPPPTTNAAPTDKSVMDPLPAKDRPAKGNDGWWKLVQAHVDQMNDAYDSLISALQDMHGDSAAPLGATLTACEALRKVAENLPPPPKDDAYSTGYAQYCAGCLMVAKAAAELQSANFSAASDIVLGHQQYSDGYQKILNVANGISPAVENPTP